MLYSLRQRSINTFASCSVYRISPKATETKATETEATETEATKTEAGEAGTGEVAEADEVEEPAGESVKDE